MELTWRGRSQRKPFRLLLMACALFGVSACAARKLPPCDTPPPFLARIEAAERINPDAHGRPHPTVVRIVQLSDSFRLERAGFQKIWNDPKAVLEKDLLESTEFTVAPGQTLERWIQRDPKARYVVAMGLFRQPLGYAWRTVAELEPVRQDQCVEQPAGDRGSPGLRDTQLRLKLQGYQIDVLRHSRRRTP